MHQTRRPDTQFSRRRLLQAGAASGVAFLAGGCGGPVFAGSNKVRYWNLFGGGDGLRMEEMQAIYEDEHPDVELEAVTLSWGAPYYTKLAMASAGGRAPEVGVMHLTRLAGFAPGRLLDPFDVDLLAEVGLPLADFPDHLVQSATVDGKLYAIPLDVHGLVFYVNRTLVEPTGLLANPNELVDLSSPDDFLSALDEIRAATGGLALATANDPSSLWRYFWSFYRQLGGDIQLPVGDVVHYDRDKMIEVLEFFLAVFDGDRASPTLDYGGGVAAFNNGEAGLLLNGNWELPTFTTARDETGEPDFTMVPVPALFGPEPSVWVDSHSLVLPHHRSRDADNDRLAYEFIATLLGNGIVWSGGGHVPAYQPVATSQEYLALDPQANYRQAAEFGQLDPEAWFTGAGAEFQNQIGQALHAVFTRSLQPEQGIDQWEAAMNRLLQSPSPV
jgi:multiple sugar transport system substrate-binding protein